MMTEKEAFAYAMEVLERLVNTPSPSGMTDAAAELVMEEIQKMGLEPAKTPAGSVWVILPEEEGESGAITGVMAHMDTLGACVRRIKKNGSLELFRIGGAIGSAVDNENCIVHTISGKTFTGSIHFEKASQHAYRDASQGQRTPETMELWLDEFVSSPEDVRALGVEVGDFVSFDPRFTRTESGFVKSRHLDDKAGVAVNLAALKYLTSNGFVPKKCIEFLFTVYEEQGHGVNDSLDRCVEELLAVDMGMVDDGTAQNGAEDAVSIAAEDAFSVYDFGLRKRLTQICKEKDIKYCTDVFNGYQSDGSQAMRSGYDCRVACIGPALRFSHSYERTHERAIEQTMRLVIHYLMTR